MSNKLQPNAIHPLLYWLNQLWLLPRRVWLRRRLQRPVTERVNGRNFFILPDVFNPVVFRTGRYLADYINAMPAARFSDAERRPTALDVGTGCGIHAIFAAARGFRVDAVDVSPEAVQCAQDNVTSNELEHLVTVLQSDLFAAVGGKRFDLVMCSLPKFRGSPGSTFEVSWRSTDVIDRFAKGLPDILKPDGIALVLLTSHGDERGMLDSLQAAGLDVQVARRKHFGVEIMTIYRVAHSSSDGCE